MERFEKIATIENEVEALCLRSELEERGIPHAIQSHYDTAYDGLYILQKGWGAVLVPEPFLDETERLIADVKMTFQKEGKDEIDECG